jgi:hypothetical protein
MRMLLIAAVAVCALAVPATASAAKKCKPVRNPYPNTRYDDADLTRVRATRVTCHGARRVAKRGHRKALGGFPSPDGYRRTTWNGWRIVGNLRGDHDRYVATKGRKRVTWRF